ncbi:enoyl-CoA hydratase/isomerase family protein [Hutsoniella sourekii]|uniref:enoyl-CoA hydratase/isomerase family protein n=1 Tax=Hutsoniella sourekii TaxID=87650 RepID=UPI0004840308|nr:enoyl-CoA hydratase/isomerase family protein [Hutsoniella sourekii]
MSAVEVKIENRVGTVTYNNPPLNILTMANLQEIEDAVAELDKNDEVAVIVFTMAMQKDGKIFCAGMDLDEMLATQEDPNGIEEYCRVSKQNYTILHRVKKPVIYVFDGVVRGGGCEMSLLADIRLSGTHLNLALPEIGIGIIPGGGGTQTLQRLIGTANAKALIYSGDVIRSERAYELGLVQEVYESDELLEKAQEYAEKIAKHSALGLQAAKRAINDGQYKPLEEGLAMETEVFVENFKTEDAAEGITAFKEKRKPVYKNR